MATWLLNTFYRVSAGERAQWVHSNALSFPSDWEDWIIKDEFTFPETLRGKPWRSPSFFAAACMRDLQTGKLCIHFYQLDRSSALEIKAQRYVMLAFKKAVWGEA